MLRADAVETPAGIEPTGRATMALGVAVCAALLAPLILPAFTGRVLLGDDLGRFHWPMRAFYARCLADGSSPLWHPGLYCGFYLHGEGQVGMDHPLHRLLYGALPLRVAFSVEVAAGYPLMLLGMGLWLRRSGLRADASLMGGMALTFSSFVLLRYVHVNAIEVLAHLPWCLLAISAFERSRWAGPLMAALTASQGLLGYPQYVGFVLLVGGSYALVLFRGAPGPLLRLLGWTLLGLVMASAQIGPHLEALAGSTRARPDAAFLGMNSLHPLNLATILVPTAFRRGVYDPTGPSPWPHHESVAYLGALVPASCAWLAMRRRSLGRSGPLALWAAVLMTAGIGLALGRYSPLFPLYVRLPGAGVFRGPSRYVAIAQVGASVLVAVAVGDAASRRAVVSRSALGWLIAPVAVCLTAALGLACVARTSPAGMRADQVAAGSVLAMSALWIGAPCLLFACAARGRRLAIPGLMMLAAADAWCGAVRPIAEHEASRPATVTPPGPERVVDSMNEGLAEGGRLVGGYVALTPRRRLDDSDPRALRLAGAAWRRIRSGAWERLALDPLPRVRLVDRAEVSRDPRSDLASVNIETTALVDRAIALETGEPGHALLSRDRPGSLDVSTSAPGRRLLVVSESYHDGWRAAIDGTPTEVVRANGDFLGVVVGPGRHEVALRFDPLGARLGRAVSWVGVGIWIGWIGLGWRTRRSPLSASPSEPADRLPRRSRLTPPPGCDEMIRPLGASPVPLSRST